MSIFVLNLATLLGLGLGVDYSLLMTSRFREELARRGRRRPGADVAEAVRLTVATAGRAVFFSGLTVLLGLLGLVLFEFMILRSVGIAGAIVVGLAVAAALTLLPALLTLLGAPPRPVRRPPGHGRRPAPTVRGRASRARVMRRPVAVLVPTLAFLLVLGLAVPARPLQRPGLERPAGGRPVARGVRPTARRVRRGRVRAAHPRRPDRRRRRPTRTTWPPCTTTRAGSPPIRG